MNTSPASDRVPARLRAAVAAAVVVTGLAVGVAVRPDPYIARAESMVRAALERCPPGSPSLGSADTVRCKAIDGSVECRFGREGDFSASTGAVFFDGGDLDHPEGSFSC